MPASVAHTRLFEQHRGALISYAAAITRDRGAAEDMVQDAWVRLQQSDAFMSAERPDAYLYRTVRNLALDRARRAAFERRHFTDNPATAAVAPSTEPDPETAAASREELRKTMAVLDSLPERMKLAVRMHRLDGARLKDIASHLGVSVTLAHELVAEGVERCRLAVRRSRQ